MRVQIFASRYPIVKNGKINTVVNVRLHSSTLTSECRGQEPDCTFLDLLMCGEKKQPT